MFEKLFNEIGTVETKLIKTKRTYLDAASKYELLANKYEEKNPEMCSNCAMCYSGCSKMYKEAGEIYLSVSYGLKSIRLFMKAAEYFYTNAQMLKSLYLDNISNALQVFNNIQTLLINDGKIVIAVNLMSEIGKYLTKFELHDDAGNLYSKGVAICINNALPPSILFSITFMALQELCIADRLDLADILIDNVQRTYKGESVTPISKSDLLAEKLKELRIYKSILLMMSYKKNECMQFTQSNLDTDSLSFFEELCDATMENQLPIVDSLVRSAGDNSEFVEGHILLLKKHVESMAKSLENKKD